MEHTIGRTYADSLSYSLVYTHIIIQAVSHKQTIDYGSVWHSTASPVEPFFRKQLHEQLHEWGRESCFGSFTMCLTM
jgi:hypothetical protein